MRKLTISLLALALASTMATANPKAAPGAEVVSGNARFTVLTDRLIRMEWSEDGIFEDRASLAVINRELPVPSFSVVRSGEGVLIKTDKVVLTYQGGGIFTGDNLSVSFRMNGKTVVWKPGMAADGNLKGTTRTLDGCLGFEKISWQGAPLEDGILSRDGWAIVDESSRHLFQKDGSDWGEWVVERPEGNRQDLYIFAYGHDYTAALGDFVKVAGRIPMPPRYTLGYWWSRYWIYTDEEMLDLGREMRERNIPMDVMIVDMDWHLTWKDMDKRIGHDEFGQRRGWTGYTWNRDLFPDPKGFLSDVHAMGYKTALNLHPASGIRPYEDCYEDFVKDYLSRTDDYDGPKDYVFDGPYTYAGVKDPCGKPGYRAPVPFRIDQQAWADAYFNSVIHPLEEQGVDFWWLDWQQWRESRYVKDLSNTFWLNYTFFNDKVRRTVSEGIHAPRPLIYHRWGGLGSHRYQLGFSGDTHDEWSVLKFLPYFTATASNVGYGYWGHDIGGHMQKKDHQRQTEPEMYTRWLQYGVFTPIFKTHSTQNARLDRRIWSYPSHYEWMKAAIDLRYALAPYIYTMSHEAYLTGISICRPMYYAYPEDDRAYTMNEEFLFGDRILATVLCTPAGPDGRTERKMWFPSGNDWYDMALHQIHKGGTEKTLGYTIDQNPWYVKAGSVLVMSAEGIRNLQDASNEYRILVVPGSAPSTFDMYEDDGTTQAYVSEYAVTRISKTGSSTSSMKLTVGPREGSYKGMPATRKVSLVLDGVSKLPKSVKLNGTVLKDCCRLSGSTVVISLPESSASGKLVVQVVQ